MEIQNQSSPSPRPRRAQDTDLAFDPTRSNREAIRKTIEQLESTAFTRPKGAGAAETASRPHDRVDVSDHGRLLASLQGDAVADQQRIGELKRRYAEGTLVTREDVELAADKMLDAGSIDSAL